MDRDKKIGNRYHELMAWAIYLSIPLTGDFMQRVYNMALYDTEPMYTQININGQIILRDRMKGLSK